MCLRVLLVPTVFLLLGAGDPEKDAKALQGIWAAVRVESANPAYAKVDIKTVRVVFKGDTLTIHAEGKPEKTTFKLDPMRKPKAIDLTVSDARNSKRKNLGIYELDGDNLKIGWRKGGPRPTEFTAEGTEYLLILKRQQKDTVAPTMSHAARARV